MWYLFDLWGLDHGFHEWVLGHGDGLLLGRRDTTIRFGLPVPILSPVRVELLCFLRQAGFEPGDAHQHPPDIEPASGLIDTAIADILEQSFLVAG